MELIELSILLASKSNSEKRKIIEEALKIMPPPGDPTLVYRETGKVVDRMVGAGLIRNEHLGVYELTTQGRTALKSALPVLQTVTAKIRYGVL